MVRPTLIRLLLGSLAIIAVFYLSRSDFVFSQSTEGQQTTGDPQQPTIIQGESDAPWYYYWPDENLNPFGMSTLGNDEGGSTFGKSTERPSNLQVNPPLQEQVPEDGNAYDETTNIPVNNPVEDTPGFQDSISAGSPSAPPKKGPIYKWVDDHGVIQVTNDLGSVPTEYLDQVNTDKEQIQAE